MSVRHDESLLAQATRELVQAKSLVALTGAGVSAESGVPTFRGAGGLWKDHRAEDLATPSAFARDPALVWEFYNYRRDLIASVRPNPAHFALADLERIVPRFTLVTQNVDGLHREAGSVRVLELHGNIWRVRCMKCGGEFDRTGERLPTMPTCSVCAGLLRPGVVWFGEALPRDIWSEAEEAIRECDCILVVGTSAVVQPAAGLAAMARRTGASVIEINLQPTLISREAHLGLYGPAGEVLPELVRRIHRGGIGPSTSEAASLL